MRSEYSDIEEMRLGPPDILVGRRSIRIGDEYALFPSEAYLFVNAVTSVRRQSGAVRFVARALLQKLGQSGVSIIKSPNGEPMWPAGIVGSLAHSQFTAVAAVARCHNIKTIGIDIEPAIPLPNEIISIVMTPDERIDIDITSVMTRCIFVLKEAVYKAAFPISKTFLEFNDIRIDIGKSVGIVSSIDEVFELRYKIGAEIVGIAFSKR